MNPKIKPILDRIETLHVEISKATEYLEHGTHADWSGFRPWFSRKMRHGKVLPPHRDWVKNVFLPQKQKALNHAEKILERLSNPKKTSHPR